MKDKDKLIEKYVKASIKYGEAQEEGDSKTVNKQSSIIRKIRAELKQDSEFGLEQLEPLLEHENDYVRLKTAFSLIPLFPVKAENVLIELSSKRGLIGFEAEMTFKEWQKGNLQ